MITIILISLIIVFYMLGVREEDIYLFGRYSGLCYSLSFLLVLSLVIHLVLITVAKDYYLEATLLHETIIQLGDSEKYYDTVIETKMEYNKRILEARKLNTDWFWDIYIHDSIPKLPLLE